MQLLENNKRENLDDIGYGTYSLHVTSKAELIDNQSFIKNVCFVKITVKRIKRQATDWEKLLVKDASDKELVSKIHEEFVKQ